MLRIKNIQKKIKTQEVLKGLSLTVEKGETMVIIGRSGAGKSVLLKHILGLMAPDSGEVWFENHPIHLIKEKQLAKIRPNMGMVFQNGALFDSMSVEENVAFSLSESRSYTKAHIKKEVLKMLELVNLSGQGEKMPSELSGGMRKRVALARSAISSPSFMMYDEPTAGLDPIASDSVSNLILCLNKELHTTSLVVTHDMPMTYKIADRVAMVHEGKVYQVTTPQELKTSRDPIISRFVRGISE